MKENNEKILIDRINGVEIFAVKDNSGATLVPIKPICTALGIDDKAQREKISEDEDLNSVGVLSPSTGADGKSYEMFCLPEKFIYGWLFTINPKNVAAPARESVRMFRRKCYNVLYDYFNGKSQRQQEVIDMERALLTEKKELDETLSGLMKSVS